MDSREVVKKFILEGKRKGQLRPKYQNMTEEELMEDLEKEYQEEDERLRQEKDHGVLFPGMTEKQ